MPRSLLVALAGLGSLALPAAPAHAQTVQDLQRQIDELKATIVRMQAAQATAAQPAAAQPSATAPVTAVAQTTPQPIAPPKADATVSQVAAQSPAPQPVAPAGTMPGNTQLAQGPSSLARRATGRKPWADRILLRGYTQLRFNEILSGDRTAPDGVSRLRSVHDSGIGDDTGFTFRRIRIVLQGDLNDRVSFYFQPDFATSISNQSGGERREGFVQLRDAYVDTIIDRDKRFRLRFGQSKVPYGWENMQSSSNRLTLDRSDGINSAVPSERDIGIIAYYTPLKVERIWKRLGDDGQKLFGNYGAFGVGVFNGQGINRTETNDSMMTVAFATWPFELDGLGSGFAGQVLEVGGSALRNAFQPELRTEGVSPVAFREERVGLHAIFYPQPIGFQAEWNWGRGPEYDRVLQGISTKSLNGGYVQTMARVPRSPLGPFMPYARWQRYRGGWKALPNAPRLETDEFELGIEFQPVPPIEFTIAYARMQRTEADERRQGTAEGNLIRTQLQWNY
jgi:hypothetical protein